MGIPKTSEHSYLAPFGIRSFRFQWPADLLTSWAFEMETLILGWYVLAETNSVMYLTVFGSLQFLGTLISPLFGVIADRVGRRFVLCNMRASYTVLAIAIMVPALNEALNPFWVLVVGLLAGMVRPSDIVMRNSLIGDTVPEIWLAKAMGLSRTTMDTARIAGALAGAGLFATLGIGVAYIGVVLLYLFSFLLTFGVDKPDPDKWVNGDSSWQDLTAGLRFIWQSPRVLALMLLAFLVNFTAYPIIMGLLPYVAREVYGVDQNGLGHLVAGCALGALLGSVAMIAIGSFYRPSRVMILGIIAWYIALIVFGLQDTKWIGFGVLVIIGGLQSFAMIAMSVALLQITPERYRGRIMGVRMLAVYGLPLGLIATGALVELLGFSFTVSLYAVIGMLCTLLIFWRWRHEIWLYS